MNSPGDELERRYRRLLTSYPLRFRNQHGEELVAVMLDGARDGQLFPTPREAANLVTHGLLARVRSRQLDTGSPAADEHPLTYGDAWTRSMVHGLGPGPVGSWTLPRWLKWLATLLAVAAIVVPIGVAIPYVFFDHALAGYGGTGSATGAIGQTSYHGLPVRPAGERAATSVPLNLRSVTPRITVNTAHAAVTVLVCTGPRWNGELIYGGTSQTAATDCTRLYAFHSATVQLGASPTRTQTGVLVAVTPHHTGTVRIEGADVSYRQGIRHGEQHVGMDWTLHVP